MNRMSDLTIHSDLMIITVDGFEPKREWAYDEDGNRYDASPVVDLPGSANWLCDAYGMSDDDYAGPGILYTDYTAEGWQFDVLIDASESEAFQDVARDAGYDILKTRTVDEPTNFGDGSGTVEVLKHRDGWVVLGR